MKPVLLLTKSKTIEIIYFLSFKSETYLMQVQECKQFQISAHTQIKSWTKVWYGL